MVYEKYIKRGGKTFGPYYYESYREGDKILTRYVGQSLGGEKKVTLQFRYAIFSLIGLILFLGIFFTLRNNFSDFGISGNVGETEIGETEVGETGEEIDSESGSFYVAVNTIDRTINTGEEIFENIQITNTAKTSASIGMTTNMSVLIDKALVGIISTNDVVVIPPFDSRDVKVRIFGLKEGVYLGNIYFFGKKITEEWVEKNVSEGEYNVSVANPEFINKITISKATYVLPVRIVVKGTKPQLVSLRAVLDRTRVAQGEDLEFGVSLFNLGFLSVYNISLEYEIVDDDGNIIASDKEDAELKNFLQLRRKLSVPKWADSEDYSLSVKVIYDGQSAVVKELFRIDEEPIFGPFSEIDDMIPMVLGFYLPIILAVLFIIILAIIGIYYFSYLKKKLFEKKIEEMKKRSMYIFPDFAKLPKSRFAYIGQVADSGIRTYLDHTQLNRHTLIAGGTGCGKSVSGMIIVEELLKKGNYPIIVFDPTGQWTGFMKKNSDRKMRELYKKFGISGARDFSTRVIEINEKNANLDIVSYLKMPGLTVLKMDRLSPKKLDKFIENSLAKIYNARLSEAGSLKSLIVLDEVHRLLPRYGGSKAHVKLEQAVREFRKWGIGLLMISQVLTDFKGAIRGNIGTEIQMRTRYEGDIKRIMDRHGSKISKLIAKLPTGLGMIECSDYNRGNPYFVEFRPLMHSQFKVAEKELSKKYLKI